MVLYICEYTYLSITSRPKRTYGIFIWVSHIVNPPSLRSRIPIEKLLDHGRNAFDDLSRAIVEPRLVLSNIVLLEQVERNIVVQMILIINAGTSTCAVTVSACSPGVKNGVVGEVIKLSVFNCLWILLLTEVADLSGITWKVQVETGSHPVVGIPEDHAGVGLGGEAADGDGVVIESGSVREELLEQVVRVGDGSDLQDLNFSVVWEAVGAWIRKVVDGAVGHKPAPGVLVLIENGVPSGLGTTLSSLASDGLGVLKLVIGGDSNELVEGSSLASLQVDIKGLSDGSLISRDDWLRGFDAGVQIREAIVEFSLRDLVTGNIGKAVGVERDFDGGAVLIERLVGEV